MKWRLERHFLSRGSPWMMPLGPNAGGTAGFASGATGAIGLATGGFGVSDGAAPVPGVGSAAPGCGTALGDGVPSFGASVGCDGGAVPGRAPGAGNGELGGTAGCSVADGGVPFGPGVACLGAPLGVSDGTGPVAQPNYSPGQYSWVEIRDLPGRRSRLGARYRRASDGRCPAASRLHRGCGPCA